MSVGLFRIGISILIPFIYTAAKYCSLLLAHYVTIFLIIGPHHYPLTKQLSGASDKNSISADTYTENFTRSAVDDVKKWWCSQMEMDSSDDDDYDYEFVR